MKCAIIGNLAKISDLKRNLTVLKVIPDSILERVIKHLKGRLGFWVGSHFNVDSTDGYVMALLLTAQQMMNLPRELVRRRTLEATHFANKELGAEVMQLGALTTSVTSGGKWIAEQTESEQYYVNHGDSFTAAMTVGTAKKIAEFREVDLSEVTVAIVGATGIIGEATSKLLVPECKKTILVGREMKKFSRFKEELTSDNYKTTTDLSEVANADLAITVTNHPSALLKPKHLQKNAVVIDVAIPSNLSEEVVAKRPDVLRIDGGLVKSPEVNLNTKLGLPEETTYACIAEVIMQALEKERRNHVGSIDLAHLKKTKKWAEKWNFELAPFTCYGEEIPLNKLKGE